MHIDAIAKRKTLILALPNEFIENNNQIIPGLLESLIQGETYIDEMGGVDILDYKLHKYNETKK